MTLQEIANDVTKLCKEGDFEAVKAKYFHEQVRSIEPLGGNIQGLGHLANPDMPKEVIGIEAINKKSEFFRANNEIHSVKVEGPFVGKGNFCLRFILDLTSKKTNERFELDEMALYTVENNKITCEHFFYDA